MRQRYLTAAIIGGLIAFLITFGVALFRAEMWSALHDAFEHYSAQHEMLRPYRITAQQRADDAIRWNHSSGLMDRAKLLLIARSLIEIQAELLIPMAATLSALFLYIWDKRKNHPCAAAE